MLSGNRRKFVEYFIGLLILWLSVSWVLADSVGEDGLGRIYGESCNYSNYCKGELVTCQNGLCSCVRDEDMEFDGNGNRCVVQAGKRCEIGGEMWTGIGNNCIQGAVCEEGFCVCGEGYVNTANGSCTRKKIFKEPCNKDAECEKNYSAKGLMCIDGSCQCDSRQGFDKDQGCLGLVDSQCDENNSIYTNDQCTVNAECQNGKCVCQNGFAKSTQGKCELGFEQPCGGTNLCADVYFICVEGECICKHPLHQMYDPRTEECLSIVSGPCTFPNSTFTENNLTNIYDIQKCTKNAHCVDRGFYSECECKPGFVQTKTGECKPGYGQSCESEECDPLTPLYCRNNHCECQDLLQIYDFTFKKCVGLVGSRCTEEDPGCVEFASCVMVDPAVSVGKCLCDKYAQEISNRTCDYRV